MATRAIVVSTSAGSIEGRLGRILEHFGVRTDALGVDAISAWPSGAGPGQEAFALFASLEAFTAMMRAAQAVRLIETATAVYLYPTTDRSASEQALRQLEGWASSSLESLGTGPCSFVVSNDLAELDGPMAGISVSARPVPEDFVLQHTGAGTAVTRLLAADGAPAFVRFEWHGVPVFLCTSAALVDIDQPVNGAFFDVKEHFCSLVPLVMFLTWACRDGMWRPLDTGACLIVDDPLLKRTYGFCDFGNLLELMNRYDFTTNVAFIPWNWRRTSSSASQFFRREGRRFSISIHGCDHTASEFGDTSIDQLDGKARLAQLRMRRHETRTGIAHDPIMVFPQGVFSSQTPGVLKRNGFIAAVNTELNPVDPSLNRTLIRDTWDVAIRRYGSFPIFTRRYASHGLENFAFDILIGKPCLIVSHHGSFKNDCAEVIDLVRGLHALRGSLTWRSLGGVIRRAGRRRVRATGSEEIEMYSGDLLVSNTTQRPLSIVVRKKEDDPSFVAGVRGDRGDLEWTTDGDGITFADTIPPGQDARYAVGYTPLPAKPRPSRPMRFEASVLARRILCEFRDEYWQPLMQR